MSNKIFYNEELNNAFQRKGYVVTDLLSSDQTTQIYEQVMSMSPDDGFKPANGRYHCTFLDTNESYKRACDLIFRSQIVPLLREVLCDFDLLAGNFYVKNPGGSGEFQVHQNWDTVDESQFTSVTVWIPLQDTTRENGTIEFVEGSHKLFPDIAAPNADYYFRDFTQAIKRKYCQPCNVRAGQAVIFDDDLIHYSTANDSDNPRISMQLEFVPRQAQHYFYFVDRAKPKEIEVYESNTEYFMKHNLTNCLQRPQALRLLKVIPNRNRQITEAEFVRRLKSGETIRKAFYEGRSTNVSIVSKILQVIGIS